MNEEEKIKINAAIITIREICEKMLVCHDCPLSEDFDSCSLLNTSPNNWRIKE